MFLAAGAAVTLNASDVPLQVIAPKDDALRPSSQVSICSAETTGTAEPSTCTKRRRR